MVNCENWLYLGSQLLESEAAVWLIQLFNCLTRRNLFNCNSQEFVFANHICKTTLFSQNIGWSASSNFSETWKCWKYKDTGLLHNFFWGWAQIVPKFQHSKIFNTLELWERLQELYLNPCEHHILLSFSCSSHILDKNFPPASICHFIALESLSLPCWSRQEGFML